MHRTGPRGLGRSYVDGLRRALQTDAALIFQMDADLSHNPEYLPALAAAAAEFDVVIGSRYLNGVSVVNWPLHRIFLSAFANRYIKGVTRLSPSDCTSGFRCWRREALAKIPLDRVASAGYAFLVEMLYRARTERQPDRRSADHLRRAAAGAVQGFRSRADGVADHSLATAAAAAGMTMPLVVVMVTTSYPRFPGDSVGTFMEPIATSVAARGHDVHVVAPWHPADPAAGARRGRPPSLLQVRAATVAERVRLRRGHARRRPLEGARRTPPRRSRSPPGGGRRAASPRATRRR